MNDAQSQPGESDLVRLGRRLGRSRSGRAFVAFLAMGFFFALAYASWHQRDLVVMAVTAGLAYFGLRVAWRTLPVPASTRAHWAKERQLAEGCSYWAPARYRDSFSSGILFLIISFLNHGMHATEIEHLAIFFLIIGSAQFIIFRISIHRAQAAAHNAAAAS
jgi:hypothetical protein